MIFPALIISDCISFHTYIRQEYLIKHTHLCFFSGKNITITTTMCSSKAIQKTILSSVHICMSYQYKICRHLLSICIELYCQKDTLSRGIQLLWHQPHTSNLITHGRTSQQIQQQLRINAPNINNCKKNLTFTLNS